MHSSKILIYAQPKIPNPEEFEELKMITLGYFSIGSHKKHPIADLKKVGIMTERKDWKTIDTLVKEGMLKSEELKIELKDTGYKQATEVRKLYSITDEGKKYFLEKQNNESLI